MRDLSTQLREYFDATAPPSEVEKVVGDEVSVPGGRKTPSRRWMAAGWAYGMATMVVVLVLILGLALLLRGGNENEVVEPTPTTTVTVPTPTTVLATAPEVEATSSEISIALAFFDARNAYDVEAATALFNPDAHIYGGDFITGVDMYPALFDWLRATGWQWMVGECYMKSGDANTECAYHVENAWSRAIGIPPVPGVIAFEIWEGGMRWVPDFEVDQTDFSIMGRASEHPQYRNYELVEVWETVTDWIRENHPTDVEAMISPDGSAPIFDARSIDLWRMYTQEFVEAVE